MQAGATVVGEKPVGSPALMDDPASFSALADALWGGKTGKGKVLASHDINSALTTLGVAPDFEYKADNADANLMFVHRKTPTAEIYYFTNRKDRAEKLSLTFAATGRLPELWDAATGVWQPLHYTPLYSCGSQGGYCIERIARAKYDATNLELTLKPHQSGYIVFRQPSKSIDDVRQLTIPNTTPLTTLPNKWNLSFQPNRGAPTGILPATLGDLATNANPAIKYFSGTASYTRTLDIKPAWLKTGQHLMLDLGEVRELAEVVINSQSAGIAWKAPYALDVTKFVHTGANKLEVKVTNLWVNRLIGDAQPDVTHKITFTTMPTYTAGAPLRPSGLIGPVVLRAGDELALASLDQ